MTLYHNIEQNRRIACADDRVDAIVRDGFRGGQDGEVWLSSRPLGDGQGRFSGVAVAVPAGVELAAYRVETDAIEDLGVEVYAIPADVATAWPRAVWVPRDRAELVE